MATNKSDGGFQPLGAIHHLVFAAFKPPDIATHFRNELKARDQYSMSDGSDISMARDLIAQAEYDHVGVDTIISLLGNEIVIRQ